MLGARLAGDEPLPFATMAFLDGVRANSGPILLGPSRLGTAGGGCGLRAGFGRGGLPGETGGRPGDGTGWFGVRWDDGALREPPPRT